MARIPFRFIVAAALVLSTNLPGLALATATAFAAPTNCYDQTGFCIDNDVIWNYFNRRGGVNTFGYPTSRSFVLEGSTVQFFQRRIVQVGPNGAGLLNLLDPGLMPYNSFNGALMPSYDSSLASSAPAPTNSEATLEWIKANAPDVFQGLPVDFYQTFFNTVSYTTAFPGGGGGTGLLPGFDLEMWGVPTSNPTFDPNNHNFVYQRFQRGIMMYDATCTCTQGILLADYFKDIITGQSLPSDLAAEAQDSPFYKQYDPSVPNGVRDPTLLPNTDLTNAFTPTEGAPGPTPAPPVTPPYPPPAPTSPLSLSCPPIFDQVVTLPAQQETNIYHAYIDPSHRVYFLVTNLTPGIPEEIWVSDNSGRSVYGYSNQVGLLPVFQPTSYGLYTFTVRNPLYLGGGTGAYRVQYEFCPTGRGP